MAHTTPVVNGFVHKEYWKETEEKLNSTQSNNQSIFITGGSTGIGKALVEYLTPICKSVNFTSGPRTKGGVYFTTEMGIRSVLSDIDALRPDIVVLNAGCHSSYIDTNFLVNLSAPLRILRHLCMNYPSTKVVYIGSRAARFYDNIIGKNNPFDNSYGCSKYMMTSVMFAQKSLRDFMVWVPPALPTSVRSKEKKVPYNNDFDKKI